MKIQDLLVEIEQDAKIDPHEVGKESLRIPSLHAKYLTYRSNEKMLLKQLNFNYNILYKERWLFYSGNATPQQYKEEEFDLKVLRGDIDIFIDGDAKLLEQKAKIAVQESKVEAIEEYLKSLGQRGWVLKNVIEWQKLMGGGL